MNLFHLFFLRHSLLSLSLIIIQLAAAGGSMSNPSLLFCFFFIVIFTISFSLSLFYGLRRRGDGGEQIGAIVG